MLYALSVILSDRMFRNNDMHGQGIYEYSDGAVYDGHYSNGIKCGQGTYTFKDKLQFYTGGKES